MTDDRRATRRAQLQGVRALCLSTKSEQIEADVRDLGRGGLFVRSVRPLSVGQRLSIDITVVGETAPWSVLGRVIWTRQAGEGEHRPPGMGIKLIVVDDAIAAAIERLIDAHERKGGAARPAVPAREMTVLGVGPSDEPSPVPAAPVLAVAPAREPTILGVGGLAEAPSREVSVPIELVSKKPSTTPPVSARETAAVPEEAEPSRGNERRGRGGGLVLVVLIVAAAVAAYVLRDPLRAQRRQWGPRQGVATPGTAATPTATTTPAATAPPPPPPMAIPPQTATPTGDASATPSASAAKKAPGGVIPLTPERRPNVKTDENPY